MNILAFIGIVLGVVGVLQLIKLMGPQAKDKVLIYLRGLVTANLEPQPTGNDISPRPAPSPIPSTTDTDSSTSVNDASDSAIDPPSATDGSPVPIDSSKEGDEIDQVLTDADFEDFSGQHIPTIQVVSGFTQVVLDQSEESGPTGSQTASGADELYTKIQESVTRLEQQMQKLYELQFQQMNSLSSSSAQSADRNVAEENNTGASAGVESDFGSSLNDDNPLVGNGLTAQLSGEVGGFVDLIEAGGSLAAGAVIEMDLADAREEPIDDSVRGIEINQYFYSLLKTKEMTHSLVEAIRQGKSEKVVRHHTRQVGRSIDYYGQHRDANVAAAMVSMLGTLPEKKIRLHDEDLATIGRLVGMSKPADDELSLINPVEAEEPESSTTERFVKGSELIQTSPAHADDTSASAVDGASVTDESSILPTVRPHWDFPDPDDEE